MQRMVNLIPYRGRPTDLSRWQSPRQYTQKLKSWKLQKNMRRNMARKPRSTASIYRRPTSRRHDSPSSKSVRPNLDEGVAHMSANQEKNEHRHHPAEIEDQVRPYQTLGVENVGETHDTAEGPGVATALDPHIAMCMFMIQNWFRFPGNYSIATNIHTDRRIFETAGDL
jgi:hypothetical protein